MNKDNDKLKGIAGRWKMEEALIRFLMMCLGR